MKRVVITGIGAVTAAGEGIAPLWEAVRTGKSAVGPVRFEDGSEGWEAVGGQVPDFDPEKYVTQRKSLKVMSRDIQLAVAGASLAMQDSGFDKTAYNPDRFGVVTGSGVFNHEIEELAYSVGNSLGDDRKLDLKKFGSSGISSLFPLWLLKYLPNMPACHISILFDLRGMNNTITTGASGGLQAVGEALRIIQRGSADRMLAGGAESKLNPVGLSEYKILGASELIVGEGAGFIVLEEMEHAKKRGARIYAEAIGFGSSYRGGQEEAKRAAIKDANLESIEKIDVTNGVSNKIVGFTGFASGVLDLAIAVMALNEKSSANKAEYAMTNAFGFNGQTASLVTRAWGV